MAVLPLFVMAVSPGHAIVHVYEQGTTAQDELLEDNVTLLERWPTAREGHGFAIGRANPRCDAPLRTRAMPTLAKRALWPQSSLLPCPVKPMHA